MSPFRLARRPVLAGLVALFSLLVLPLAAAAQDPLTAEDGEVLAEGLNTPQGLLVDENGDVWVIDTGVGGEESVRFLDPETEEIGDATRGNSTLVQRIDADGEVTEEARLPSVSAGSEFLGGGRLALVDGELYATVGAWAPDLEPEEGPIPAGVYRVADGGAEMVGEIWAYERDNNPDGNVLDSHPYGLAASPSGRLWTTDSGGNALYLVNPEDGSVQLITAFDPLPGAFPNENYEGEALADAVPTGVVVDEDGSGYVALLTGGPFTPGSAKVMRIWRDGAATDWATGLTMLTDLRRGPDGELYATQFARFGPEGPDPASGAIVRVREGDASELVVSGLAYPTSLDFAEDGTAYVTQYGGFSPPGEGQVLRFDDLTDVEGTPLDDAAPAMDDESEDEDERDGEMDDETADDADDDADESAEPSTLPKSGGLSDAGLLGALLVALLAALGLGGFTLERRTR